MTTTDTHDPAHPRPGPDAAIRMKRLVEIAVRTQGETRGCRQPQAQSIGLQPLASIALGDRSASACGCPRCDVGYTSRVFAAVGGGRGAVRLGQRSPTPRVGRGAAPGRDGWVIVNSLFGRGIRRVVAQASVFPNAEKANVALRMVAAAGALGLDRVLMSTDDFGRSSSPSTTGTSRATTDLPGRRGRPRPGAAKLPEDLPRPRHRHRRAHRGAARRDRPRGGGPDDESVDEALAAPKPTLDDWKPTSTSPTDREGSHGTQHQLSGSAQRGPRAGMERDSSVVVLGEDNDGCAGAPRPAGRLGRGALGSTKGLYDRFPGPVLMLVPGA